MDDKNRLGDTVDEYLTCSYAAAGCGDWRKSRNYLAKAMNLAIENEIEIPSYAIRVIESDNIRTLSREGYFLARDSVSNGKFSGILKGLDNALLHSRRLSTISGEMVYDGIEELRDAYLSLDEGDIEDARVRLNGLPDREFLGEFKEDLERRIRNYESSHA